MRVRIGSQEPGEVVADLGGVRAQFQGLAPMRDGLGAVPLAGEIGGPDQVGQNLASVIARQATWAEARGQ
jgi:hypothetical protein